MKKWLAIVAAALLIVQGCSQENEKSKEAPENQADTGTEAFSYPLTGLKAAAEPDERAVAVMVNNHPEARPQSGLDKADIVFEVLAEGHITRFLAIYESEKPEKVGPVRSARDYYIELAKGYDSLFVAHGYSPDAKKLLSSGYIDELNGMQYDGTLFERVSFRQAPHNSYIDFESIEAGAEERGYSMDAAPAALLFGEPGEMEGDEAESVLISYGDSSYDSEFAFDAAEAKYHRYSAGVETADYESENPVKLDNVIIVEMDHSIVDQAGRRSIDLTSGGNGYLLQEGMVKEIEWKNSGGRIIPYIEGREAPLVPGKTWISIVPQLEQVAFEAGSQ